MGIGDDLFRVVCVKGGGLEKDTTSEVANVESAKVCSLSKFKPVVSDTA
jgi:hypothetical protein